MNYIIGNIPKFTYDQQPLTTTTPTNNRKGNNHG